jgi:glc operon protein GlcG
MPEEITGVAMRPTLTELACRALIDAAVAAANAMAVPITVVVVDESGVTKEMLRMDEAPLVSVQTALNKAYAAAAIGMPPDDFFSAIEADSAAVASFAGRPGLALIAGGVPVLANGRVAGAVGVAGAMTGAEDRQIAMRAVDETFTGDGVAS